MKLVLAALLLFAAIPAEAKPGRYSSSPGYARQEKCFKKEYREEYIPGTMNNPGYVRSYQNRVQVPCENESIGYYHQHNHNPYYEQNVDNNDCSQGSILGGIAGGGLGAALSRGDGRWWAIPLGVVGGAMVGCQVDGG